jgi:hypothetical protein
MYFGINLGRTDGVLITGIGTNYVARPVRGARQQLLFKLELKKKQVLETP